MRRLPPKIAKPPKPRVWTKRAGNPRNDAGVTDNRRHRGAMEGRMIPRRHLGGMLGAALTALALFAVSTRTADADESEPSRAAVA